MTAKDDFNAAMKNLQTTVDQLRIQNLALQTARQKEDDDALAEAADKINDLVNHLHSNTAPAVAATGQASVGQAVPPAQASTDPTAATVSNPTGASGPGQVATPQLNPVDNGPGMPTGPSPGTSPQSTPTNPTAAPADAPAGAPPVPPAQGP